MEQWLNETIKLAEQMSITKQLEMISNDFTRIYDIHLDSITAFVKPGTKYYVLGTSSSREYFVDKQNGQVFDFYKRYRGTIAQIISNLKRLQENYIFRIKQIGRASELANVRPIIKSVNVDRPVFSSVGKIYVASWGYGMTLVEFVKVISETPKTAKVVKLKTIVKGDRDPSGGKATPGEVVSAPFVLQKQLDYKKQPVLRGTDKSGSSRSEPMTWYAWDGTEQYHNTWD